MFTGTWHLPLKRRALAATAVFVVTIAPASRPVEAGEVHLADFNCTIDDVPEGWQLTGSSVDPPPGIAGNQGLNLADYHETWYAKPGAKQSDHAVCRIFIYEDSNAARLAFQRDADALRRGVKRIRAMGRDATELSLDPRDGQALVTFTTTEATGRFPARHDVAVAVQSDTNFFLAVLTSSGPWQESTIRELVQRVRKRLLVLERREARSGHAIRVTDPLRVQSQVDACLETATTERRAMSGTPIAWACQPMFDSGAAAAPMLILRLEESSDPDLSAVIVAMLSKLCCHAWGGSRSKPEATHAQIKEWWLNHRGTSRSQWVVEALGSPDHKSRKLACGELPTVTSPALEPSLEAFLASPDQGVEIEVFKVLWKNYRSQAAINHARKVLYSGDFARARAYIWLTKDNEVAPLFDDLVALLEKAEPSSPVAVPLITVVGDLKLTAAAEVLKRWDKESWPEEPGPQIIRALARIEGSAYDDRLLHHLAEGGWRQRRAAAGELSRVADPEAALRPLIAALSDPEHEVRKAATWSLGGIAARGLPFEDLELISQSLLHGLMNEPMLDPVAVNRAFDGVAASLFKAYGEAPKRNPRKTSADREAIYTNCRDWWLRVRKLHSASTEP